MKIIIHVADREAEEFVYYVVKLQKIKLMEKTTALEEELDIAFRGVQPLVQPDLLPYIEAEQPKQEQPKLPNNEWSLLSDRYIGNKPTQTPASTPASHQVQQHHLHQQMKHLLHQLLEQILQLHQQLKHQQLLQLRQRYEY